MQQLKPGDTIIINDLVNIGGNILLQRHIAHIFSAIASKDSNLLVTSNYSVPVALSQDYGIDIYSRSMPGFTEEDTASLLKLNGADDAVVSLIGATLTSVTQGHPLLIQSAVKYFKDRNWQTDGDALSTIFLGKFSDAAEKETYARVLEFTANPATRELFYRLRYAMGDIDMDLINRISNVVPAIPLPAEKSIVSKGYGYRKRDRELFNYPH